MNCLLIKPGTSRKPGAMLRKCAAQAARLICGGSLYWTIAVIMVRLPSAAACCRMVCSFLHLAGLKDTDGLGELPGLPWAAAEFTQDAPGFELGIGALAGAAQPGVGPVGGLLGGGLSPALAGGTDVVTGTGVALIREHDQP